MVAREQWTPVRENADKLLHAYATAFILARIFFSHMADAIGGAKVALVCALIEAVGQALIWLAVRPEMALIGAALTGFGFSLVNPGFGVEAVRQVPAQSRGLAPWEPTQPFSTWPRGLRARRLDSVIVKLYSGKSEREKQALAQAVREAVTSAQLWERVRFGRHRRRRTERLDRTRLQARHHRQA
jgi:hypothetical protein